MDPTIPEENQQSWFDKPVASFLPKLKIEHLIIAIILILAVVSRLMILGVRDLDHDEVNHVVPSYELYQGQGYIHNPVTHGPLQFHLIAATYFLFGDSDFTSRLPHALFSIATIAFVIFGFKRYLGRVGAILAGIFFLISPYMLFYGRYARNESFMALFAVVMIWAVLNYLEKGKISTLYVLAVSLVLMFVTKEIVYIYAAILLIFLAVLFMRDVMEKEWITIRQKNAFLLSVVLALAMVGVALAFSVVEAKGANAKAATAGGIAQWASGNLVLLHDGLLVGVGAAVILFVLAVIFLTRGLGWKSVRQIRSFDLLMLVGTLVIPQLVAMAVSLMGWNSLDYSQTGLIRTSIVLVVLFAISAALGIFWRPKVWLISTAVFYTVFTVFYTTFFTNGQGFFTGIVGGLGYWLSQQAVDRGTQPLYYYAFLQVPMYEYLGVLGTLAAIWIAAKKKLFWTIPGFSPAHQPEPVQVAVQLPLALDTEIPPAVEELPQKLPVVPLLVYLAIMNLLAYTVAGEKMPWLTVHIALPMLLAAGWGIGYIIDRVPWRDLLNRRGILALLLIPVFLTALGATLAILLGANQPFAGVSLEQLQTTATFIFSLLATLLSGWGLLKLLEEWETWKILTLFIVALFAVLTVQTARSAYQASFINYDNSKEFLVYAHGASGPKEVLKQVEEISKRTVGYKDVKVAYIGDALYPYWWYFRDYPNRTYLEKDLTKELTTYPLVISDSVNYDKVKSILKDDYVNYHYIRLWWPMQDYDNQTLATVWEALKNPAMRQALFDIWANKDYTLYAELKDNPNLTLETWQPRADIYFFVRKDIVSQIWNYGTLPAAVEPAKIDPYAAYAAAITPDRFFGAAGTAEGQLMGARGIALAKDGTLYVVDSGNNRIEHFAQDGKLIKSWGSFASVDAGEAPGGTFNQPFGIALGPDGSVYVADTWNFRIQKFTADGQFLTMWGVAGQAETPESFWGPRGLAVDAAGNVFVTDTGNKRVVVFDQNGTFVTQFGTYGMNPGEFDEPVGIAIDKSGTVFVADTWNQRIQIFSQAADGSYAYLREWEVAGWKSQSVDNKPFLSIDPSGNIFTVDTDSFRVFEFHSDGQIVRTWGDYSSGIDGFGIPSGLVADDQGGVWVADAGNNYVLHYTMPTSVSAQPQATPPFPSAAVQLSLDALSGNLQNPFGQAVYRLDTALNEWVPLVPNEISVEIPAGSQPAKNDSNLWVLNGIDGKPLFTWNGDLLLWVSSGPVISGVSVSPTATQ